MLAQKLLMWTLVRRSAPKRARRDNTFQDPVLVPRHCEVLFHVRRQVEVVAVAQVRRHRVLHLLQNSNHLPALGSVTFPGRRGTENESTVERSVSDKVWERCTTRRTDDPTLL